ncbi:WD40-repeat-containing domain protein [Flammula alnicola]|nr:WD40-repeat-containing domain protein [Flammula alnicola]
MQATTKPSASASSSSSNPRPQTQPMGTSQSNPNPNPNRNPKPKPKPKQQIIDVDELFAQKYEIDEDDIIVPIDAHAYRQGVRQRSNGKEKEKERARSRSHLNATTPGPLQREPLERDLAQQLEYVRQQKHAQWQRAGSSSAGGGGSSTPDATASTSAAVQDRSQREYGNYPSTIGSAIQEMRAKRPSPATAHQPTMSAPSQSFKRRKLDTVTPAVAPPVPSTSTRAAAAAAGPSSRPAAAVAGPSKAKAKATTPRAQPSIAGPPPRALPQPQPQSRAQPAKHVQLPTKRVHEVIELSSDGEEVAAMLTPRKKQKSAIASAPVRSCTPIEILSDSEYGGFPDYDGFPDITMADPIPIHAPEPEPESSDDDWDPPGFDLNDLDRWKPMAVNENKMSDDSLVENLELLDIAAPPPRVPLPLDGYVQPDTSRWDPPPPRRRGNRGPLYIWEQLNAHVRVPPRARPIAMQLPSRPVIPPWKLDFDLYKLKRVHSFKKAPGSINKIAQKGPWTVIASGCVGGLPDQPDEQGSPFNREGSLMTWRDELDIPKGHQATKRDRVKHYAVHDLKFDPTRLSFATSGADHRVRIWDLPDGTQSDDEDDPNDYGQASAPVQPKWTNRLLDRYHYVPHELAFKPNSSLLAVAEKKIQFYSLSQSNPEPRGAFYIHPPKTLKTPHIVGAMAWGTESSVDHLFASSEPSVPELFEGLHKVYDIHRQTVLYQLDATEAGDTLCLNSTGTSLALATRASGTRNILRMYDVARRDGKATTTIDLEPFPLRYKDFEGEVASAMFSPDGIFLALARNDNQTHVYDVRYLHSGRPPIYMYEHSGECKAALRTCVYGVVKAQWLQSRHSRRIALVTGGEDGCVRVWDPRLSASDSNNGKVVAEVNSDIGHFSLGDPFAGEHQLVVGDCNGEVSIFDNVIL